MNVTAKEAFIKKLLDGSRVATAVRGEVCFLGIRQCKKTPDFILCGGLEIIFGQGGGEPWTRQTDLERRVAWEEIIEIHDISTTPIVMEAKNRLLKMKILREPMRENS